MLKSTRDGVRAICAADPSLSTAQVNAAILELDGKGNALPINTSVADRVLSRKQTADLLHVSLSTLSQYAKRGLLKSVRLGSKGIRANGYTESSVRKLIEAAKIGEFKNER